MKITLRMRSNFHTQHLTISLNKFLLTKIILFLAPLKLFQKLSLFIGKGDPTRFTPPNLKDHAFIVLEKV